MTQHKAIGIDLGTTNSCVAWVDEAGHTAMVPNAEGDLLTPSMVLFDDAEVVVGKEARNACIVEPSRVAIWVKRDMGAPVYSRPIRGEYLPPEVIQACILRKLRSDVVHTLGRESQVVITVPAYFDEPRRKATADAGEMAGLKVLDIVNEPPAGALAFGEVLGYLSRDSAPQRSLTVLVYDLGGGTFDSTLLRLSPGNIQMIATDGDVQLGGYDWDMRLLAHVAEAFKRTHGSNPRNDPSSTNRLFREVVEAKHTLSSRGHAKIRVDHAGQHIECEITRQAFEEMTSDLLERTTYTTRQLLAAAKLDWKDLDRILLVGGATRMPVVPRMLEQISGIRPDHTVNPDEAVARGAALYAHYLLSKATPGAAAAFEVGNVNAHSLGVEGIEAETLRKRNVVLISRNTPLPAKVTQRFATKIQGQRSIVVKVLEGESPLPSECTAIGRTAIRDLPMGLPQGWPVEVTFEYGTNGRLSVRAAVPGTHQDSVLDLERDIGLSREGVARWKRAVSSGGFAGYESALSEVKRTDVAPPAELAGGHDWAMPPIPAANPPAHATPPIPIARSEVAPASPIATPPIPAVPGPGVAPASASDARTAPFGPVGQAAGASPGWQTPATAWPRQNPGSAGLTPGAGQPQPGPAWQPPAPTWQGQPGAGYPAQPAVQPGWPSQNPCPPDMPGPAYPGSPAPGAYPTSPYPVPGAPFGQPGPPAGADPWAGQAAYGYAAGPSTQIDRSMIGREPGLGRKILNVLGHLLAAGLGLFVGYLFLTWLRPDLAIFHWLPIHR